MTRPIKDVLLCLLLLGSACKGDTIEGGLVNVPGHDTLAQDNSHKESPRLMAAEGYLRSYLRIFGGLTALQTQTALASGGDGLFDSWSNYLAALGLPNYSIDLPRGAQTNALMVATFERLGIALCDKALLKDWSTTTPVAMAQRAVFAFDPPKDVTDKVAFTAAFDVLHRTFLGYPVRLAPTNRVDSYFDLFTQLLATHTTDPKASRFTPNQEAWAAMCYGLVRHPEFQLY
jgi:hypothetical protein